MLDGVVPGWLSLAQQASLPVLAISALMIAVSKFITVLPQLRQTQAESDKSLRSDLLQRIDVLETEVKALRKALDNQRMTHAAETMDMLHDLANESGNLDAVLLLAEVNPKALIDQLPKLREQRDQHRERMAIKRGAREAALISVPPVTEAAAA